MGSFDKNKRHKLDVRGNISRRKLAMKEKCCLCLDTEILNKLEDNICLCDECLYSIVDAFIQEIAPIVVDIKDDDILYDEV